MDGRVRGGGANTVLPLGQSEDPPAAESWDVRIFRWFGATILATGATFGLVFHHLGSERDWAEERGRVERFVAAQLALVWDDVPRRDALLSSAARDLGVALTLRANDSSRI